MTFGGCCELSEQVLVNCVRLMYAHFTIISVKAICCTRLCKDIFRDCELVVASVQNSYEINY